MMSKLARGGALAGAAAALLAVSPGAARPPSPLGFGIQAEGQPYFLFDAAPGRAVRGTLLVTNTTTRPRTVLLRAADGRTAATGGVDYGPQGARPRGAGTWISLSRQRVELPGSGAAEVPFTARVPRGAWPGDHLAGIVAYGPQHARRHSPRSRFRLKIVSRMAIAVQLRVPGPRAARLELRSEDVQVSPTGAVLGLKLANTGNVLVPRTVGRISVLQHGRRLFSQPVRVDSFVPGTEITYPVQWRARPVEADYRVEGRLRPVGAVPIALDRTVRFGRKRIREFRRDTGRPATESPGSSPAVYALLLVTAAALAALGLAYLRLRGRVAR